MSERANTHADVAAEERARQGWSELRARLRRVGPADLGRLALAAAGAAAVIWLAVISWPALLPFAIGGFLAYLLRPLVSLLDRLLPRPLAAGLALAAFGALAAAVMVVLAPALVEQVVRLYRVSIEQGALEHWRAQLDAYLQTQPEPVRELARDYLDQVGATLRSQADGLIGTLAASSVLGAISVLNIVASLLGIVLLPIWVFGLLARRPAGPLPRNLLPPTIEADLLAIWRICDRALGAFVRGRLLSALSLGMAMYAGLALIELQGAMTFRYKGIAALFAAVLQLIPQVGPIVAGLLLLIFSLASAPLTALAMVGSFLGAQLAVAALVAPRLDQRLNNLNPAVLVLFIAALSQLGLWWVLLAAPTMAIVNDLFRYAYGRLGSPARPAGLLPDEPVAAPGPPRRRRSQRQGARQAGGIG